MRKSPMPPRKRPLKAGKPLRRSSNGLKASKGLKRGKRLPKRASRAGKAWVRQFHSKAFVAWTHEQPCVRCGQTPSEPHHEPLRSQGGTWKNVSPVCAECHTLAGDSRHNTSAARFWTFGVTAEQANMRHHGAWLEHATEPLDP